MPQQGGAMGIVGMIAYIAIIIAIFYFIAIRPQRKKDKQLQAMIDAIQVGDDIVTIGGIYGTVARIKTVGEKERRYFIESSKQDKTTIEVASWAIKDVLKYVEDK